MVVNIACPGDEFVELGLQILAIIVLLVGDRFFNEFLQSICRFLQVWWIDASRS